MTIHTSLSARNALDMRVSLPTATLGLLGKRKPMDARGVNGAAEGRRGRRRGVAVVSYISCNSSYLLLDDVVKRARKEDARSSMCERGIWSQSAKFCDVTPSPRQEAMRDIHLRTKKHRRHTRNSVVHRRRKLTQKFPVRKESVTRSAFGREQGPFHLVWSMAEKHSKPRTI